jgi:hypothetical protein
MHPSECFQTDLPSLLQVLCETVEGFTAFKGMELFKKYNMYDNVVVKCNNISLTVSLEAAHSS